MVHAETPVLPVPVFMRVSVHTTVGVTVVHWVVWALTVAVLVNDPNRPNTNPAIATAAMSVIAMRMTVGHRIYGLVTVGQGNSH
jgi:hypothetical protein